MSKRKSHQHDNDTHEPETPEPVTGNPVTETDASDDTGGAGDFPGGHPAPNDRMFAPTEDGVWRPSVGTTDGSPDREDGPSLPVTANDREQGPAQPAGPPDEIPPQPLTPDQAQEAAPRVEAGLTVQEQTPEDPETLTEYSVTVAPPDAICQDCGGKGGEHVAKACRGHVPDSITATVSFTHAGHPKLTKADALQALYSSLSRLHREHNSRRWRQYSRANGPYAHTEHGGVSLTPEGAE